ncbi:MAG: tyrosine-type recombinase/integrase [Comamonas sp.]
MTSETKYSVVLLNPKYVVDPRSFVSGCVLVSMRYQSVKALAAVVDDGGLPHVAANAFLAFISLRSGGITHDTVHSYAYALKDWLCFLHSRGETLHDVTEETLQIYRNEKLNHFTRPQASNTVGHRISVVCGFMKYLYLHGYNESALGSLLNQSREVSGWRAFGGRKRGKLSINLRKDKRRKKILTIEEISLLSQYSTDCYRKIFFWMLLTGMRRCEVCELKVKDLPTIEEIGRSDTGLVEMEVTGKGGYQRTIQVLGIMLEDIIWGIMSENRLKPTEYVFLNTRNQPITRNALTKAFGRFAKSIKSKSTLHGLRHSFATNVLNSVNKSAVGLDVNSLKVVQTLLGHACVTTTETYIDAIETASPEVMKALAYLYGERDDYKN